MERMNIGRVDTQVLFPLKNHEFYGMNYKVPADPITFLRQRYGEGWSKPDRFFEWRWKLSPDTEVAA